jgi:outer membrane protein insertion porin family
MANAGLYIDAYHSKVSALAFKLKSGYIQAYRGETQNTPLNRRFYAGGSNSVRGWPSRGLSPNESNITSLSALGNEDLIAVFNNTATAIGGTFLFEGSAETRNRLFGDFGGALFLDFGNTWNGYKSMRVDEIAVATGFGFRYYTPVGPIRLDFGFKTYDPEDKRWIFKKPFFKQLQFHIAIGEAF